MLYTKQAEYISDENAFYLSSEINLNEYKRGSVHRYFGILAPAVPWRKNIVVVDQGRKGALQHKRKSLPLLRSRTLWAPCGRPTEL